VNRADKATVIEQFKAKADGANIAVVTDFQGMKVEEMTALRVKLREAGVDYQVVKNTLARIAFTGGKHETLNPKLKECCAIALGYDDPVATAKVLVDYAKTSKKFKVRYACLDGKFISDAGVVELSKLPGKPELLAKMLGTMNAVPTNFVGLFANILRSFLYALKAIQEQKEGA